MGGEEEDEVVEAEVVVEAGGGMDVTMTGIIGIVALILGAVVGICIFRWHKKRKGGYAAVDPGGLAPGGKNKKNKNKNKKNFFHLLQIFV